MDIKITHTVLKNEDIEKYLSETDKRKLTAIVETIACHRIADLKKINKYIICNTDEPYAEKVLKIIRQEEETHINPINTLGDQNWKL